MASDDLKGRLREESMEESEDEHEVTATTSQRGGKKRRHWTASDKIRQALAQAREGVLIDGNELEKWEEKLKDHYEAALTINEYSSKKNPSKKTKYDKWAVEFSREHEEVLNELEEIREPLMTTSNRTPLTTPVGSPTGSPTRNERPLAILNAPQDDNNEPGWMQGLQRMGLNLFTQQNKKLDERFDALEKRVDNELNAFEVKVDGRLNAFEKSVDDSDCVPNVQRNVPDCFPEGCASDRMLITHWSIWLRTYDNEWRSVLKDISPLRLCGSEWMTNLVTP